LVKVALSEGTIGVECFLSGKMQKLGA
jgi:hypothetical protein